MSPDGAVRSSTDTLGRLDRLADERGIELIHDAPIGPLTTLRVGGTADRLATPRDVEALLATLRLGREAGVPWFVLGNGSNLVVADLGIRGLVIRNRARQLRVSGTRIRADAGAPMALLVRRATGDGLSGLEFGISIPGTVGGAIWANAGAHGTEVRDVLARVTTWDPADDAVAELGPDACAFDYRESRFKHSSEVIVEGEFALSRGDPDAIAARVAAHQAKRRATQPLAEQNAGSVFRNPPGDHAGRLADAAGLKGRRIGSAMVSPLHANFIVTDRGGRAADVRRLGELMRQTIEERFGISLEFEIEFVGEWADGTDDDPMPNAEVRS